MVGPIAVVLIVLASWGFTAWSWRDLERLPNDPRLSVAARAGFVSLLCLAGLGLVRLAELLAALI